MVGLFNDFVDRLSVTRVDRGGVFPSWKVLFPLLVVFVVLVVEWLRFLLMFLPNHSEFFEVFLYRSHLVHFLLLFQSKIVLTFQSTFQASRWLFQTLVVEQ